MTHQTKRYKVNVPAGVSDGTRIRVAGKGEAGQRGAPAGDLFVTIQVAPSPVFKRLDDGNLEVNVPITVTEALRGGTVEVPTLTGTKRIRVKPGHPARIDPATQGRRAAPQPVRRPAATSATGSRSSCRPT